MIFNFYVAPKYVYLENIVKTFLWNMEMLPKYLESC